jgi:hypothetical protein
MGGIQAVSRELTDDEIKAAERMLGIELTDWQKEFMRNVFDGNRIVAVSRRGGRKVAWRAIEHVHGMREGER